MHTCIYSFYIHGYIVVVDSPVEGSELDSKHTATVLTSDLAALEGESEELLRGTGLHYRRQSTELALIQPIVLHSGGMHNVN